VGKEGDFADQERLDTEEKERRRWITLPNDELLESNILKI
jgi:hypothetical protein